MNITVVGAGRVGLANAAFLRAREHDVTIIDKDPNVIRMLKAGKEPFEVPFFQRLFQTDLKGNTEFQTEPNVDTNNSDLIIICVPWHQDYPHSIDGYILTKKPVIIRSSLSPDQVTDIESYFEKDDLATTAIFPEFLVEGQESEGVIASRDQYIGYFNIGSSFRVKEAMAAAYMLPLDNIYKVESPQTAAAIKISTNIALAMKVTTANVIRDIFDSEHVSIKTVLSAVEDDPRLGRGYFKAGIGYGGSCLPWAMEIGGGHAIIEAVQAYNREDIIIKYAEQIEHPALFFGYNFKAGVKDHRCSNQLDLIKYVAVGGEVFVTDNYRDPVVDEWWTDDPLSLIPYVKTIVIFYSTRELIAIENYLDGEPLDSDEEFWNNIKKIDFRKQGQ